LSFFFLFYLLLASSLGSGGSTLALASGGLLDGLLDLGEADSLVLLALNDQLGVAHGLGLDCLLLGEGVEAEAKTAVAHAVGGLGEGGRLLGLELLGLEGAADFLGADDAGDVGVGDGGGGEEEALLDGGLLGEGAEDLVELLEGALGPDDEATEVTAGGEVEEVQGVDVGGVEAVDVAEGGDALGVGEDEHGAAAVDVAAVAHLAAAGADLAGSSDAVDVVVGADGGEEGEGFLGLAVVLDGVVNDEGDFGDVLDLVAAGLDEAGDGGSGEGGDDGVALLVVVDLTMPAAVSLGGGEHTTATAHVAEGTSTAGLGTRAGDTGDTGDGAAGTPGSGRVVHAGEAGDGVSLTSVLGHLGVDELNDVVTDGSGEDGRERNITDGLVRRGRVDGDCRTGRHFFLLKRKIFFRRNP
jgi:hypothetical protein